MRFVWQLVGGLVAGMRTTSNDHLYHCWNSSYRNNGSTSSSSMTPRQEQNPETNAGAASAAPAKSMSERLDLLRRGLQGQDEKPSSSRKTSNIVDQGFPGNLSDHEIEQCLIFYKAIQDRPTAKEIVYHFSEFEEEPYTICRFMRAVKFDAAKMLERLEEGADYWKEAQEQGFYPNVEKALGAPKPVFLQMFPSFYHGNAKNGCPVKYFKPGMVDVEGVLCFTKIEHAARWFWYSYAYHAPNILKRTHEKDPNFRRLESIAVMDLQGVSYSLFDSDTRKVVQFSGKVGEYFPETLHCMLIINAPSWFSMAWRMVKRFINPRTANRIEVYSKPARGQERLLELVDAKELLTDFGGSGLSMQALMQQGGSDHERHVVKRVHLTRQKTHKLSDWIELKEGESVSIKVYTRSVSGAAVSVLQDESSNSNSKPVVDPVKVVRSSPPEDPPAPFCTEICHGITGPATISVHLEDLGLVGVAKSTKNQPVGYFLVAATVRS